MSFPHKKGKCPLFSFCNCKTAVCSVWLPNDECWYYRYFKKLIEEDEKEVKEKNKNALQH